MGQKVKVLILDNSNGVTGAFRSIYSITQKIQNDYEFYYGVPDQSKLIDFLKSEGKIVSSFPFLELQRNYKVIFYLPFLILNTWRILRFVRQHHISVVHVNDLYNMCGVLIKLVNRNIKVVYHVRLLSNSYISMAYRFFVRLIARHADSVIAVSESVKRELSEFGLNPVVVYDALSIEKYPPRVQKSKNLSIALLYLANFIPGKGHNYAIQAFAIARTQIPELKMIMAGGDLGLEKNILLKNKLKKAVEEMGLSDKITFYGFVEDVEKLMKTSDIVLNFSESESFSLICLEALTYGVPLIATNSGGPKELFDHEQSGLLVPNRDVNAMASAIFRLAGNRELQARFAKAGKEYVLKKFSADESAQSLRSLYLQIIQ